MSLINDYSMHALYAQRRAELMTRAAEEGWARGIRAGSTPWWRRLFVRRTGPVRAVAGGVRTPQHRVAH